ncbi:MAG: type II restriction endonuclease subunit M [Lactobacillus sp.]|nr:MAG: type II restriction endonuclease subunit M [Lactobacillus sp.]
MGTRYKKENNDKKNGVVYTPSDMANYVAEEMLDSYKGIEYKDIIFILDPAVGEGELLVALIRKLIKFGKKIVARGYETDKEVSSATQIYLSKMFPDITVDIKNEDFLYAVENDKIKEKYDFIIANPPYVRTQILGSEAAQKIADKVDLKGRVDIYYAFLVYTKKVLSEQGVAGYITSNKFFTIKAGASVRNFMLHNYSIKQITDLGDTKMFTAAVLPCVMIFTLGKTDDSNKVHFSSVYESKAEKEELKVIDNIFEAIHYDGLYKLTDGRTFRFRQGKLCSSDDNQLWTLVSEVDKKWINVVDSNTLMHFSDLGKIRVGIKTTADNVFIGDDWNGEKGNIELLRPLITHRNAGQFVGKNNNRWKVLYTHTSIDGKKVPYDIDKYPNAKKYLLDYYDQLSGRTYLKKANRKWYEIWVPQNPSSWSHRKIVFRDISEEPQFWLDESGAVVNGDCYWIDIKEDVPEEMVYLALAVANSTFIEKYYDMHFNTKLYSGKRRYQTQYVEQFPIPYYGTEAAKEAIATVKKIITEDVHDISGYKEKINNAIEKAFSQRNQ